jgi:hypothetical protein
MSDRPSGNLGGLDIELSRRIDEICRRFEADWRQGRRPRIEDYLVDVPDHGRPALRAELTALEREVRQSEEAAASGRPALTPRRRRSRNSPTAPIPRPSLDDEAKVNTGRQRREARLARFGPTTPKSIQPRLLRAIRPHRRPPISGHRANLGRGEVRLGRWLG